MVKIKATGFGVTALVSGTILHFDADEANKPKAQRDMRKLQADVELVDAKRIEELGWGKIVGDVDEEEDRAELGDDVSKLEVAPAPEAGKPAQVAPPADRDSPERNAALLAKNGPPRAKRPSELAKAAKKAEAKPAAEGAAKADADDPEAGPAKT